MLVTPTSDYHSVVMVTMLKVHVVLTKIIDVPDEPRTCAHAVRGSSVRPNISNISNISNIKSQDCNCIVDSGAKRLDFLYTVECLVLKALKSFMHCIQGLNICAIIRINIILNKIIQKNVNRKQIASIYYRHYNWGQHL